MYSLAAFLIEFHHFFQISCLNGHRRLIISQRPWSWDFPLFVLDHLVQSSMTLCWAAGDFHKRPARHQMAQVFVLSPGQIGATLRVHASFFVLLPPRSVNGKERVARYLRARLVLESPSCIIQMNSRTKRRNLSEREFPHNLVES